MATKKILGLVGYTDKGTWVEGYSFAYEGETITGYDANDIVHTENGVYVSKADGNTTNPDEDASGWTVWVDTSKLAAAIAAADGIENVDVTSDGTKIVITDRRGVSSIIDVANLSAVAEAVNKATEAAQEASNCNLVYANDQLSVTGRDGVTQVVDLASAASVSEVVSDAKRASLALGHYSDRDDITLVATETGKAISSDGVKVSKSGWAIAEFTAEKGNEYLFKPGVTDGSVCVFAEYIDKVEDRAIDYTYTYNTDGTIATATATYGGKTYKYTYTYDASGTATITDASGTVVSSLPLLYTTAVGTYSPLVRLNADAELPTDGYCRFMSHFQGNSSLKVVVSYKVGSADLTMKVLRDGVFASISTQLGNLSQKQSDTASELAGLTKSRMSFILRKYTTSAPDAPTIYVDGVKNTCEYGKKYTISPKLSMYTHAEPWRSDNQTYGMSWIDASHLDTSTMTSMAMMFATAHAQTIDAHDFDTSKVINMFAMFYGCSSLATLDVSGWDTSKVTNMQHMFYGCSSLATLDVSGWDTSKVTNMRQMFYGCSSLATLDVSGWDTSKVTNMSAMFYGCGVKVLDLTGWDMSNVSGDGYMFGNAGNLTSLIGTHTLAEVEAGEVVAMPGRKSSLTIAYSSKLERASLLALIKGLADLTGSTSQTLTLNGTQKNKLTADDIAIATAKNWVIA